MQKSIEFKAKIDAVQPKQGKGNSIKVSLDTKYTDDSMMGLCEAMMKSEGPVTIMISYDPLPLFKKGDVADGQQELDMNPEVYVCENCGHEIHVYDDEYPEKCPECGVDVVIEDDEVEAYQCSECGYIVQVEEGIELPRSCPGCGAPFSAMSPAEIEDDESVDIDLEDEEDPEIDDE